LWGQGDEYFLKAWQNRVNFKNKKKKKFSPLYQLDRPVCQIFWIHNRFARFSTGSLAVRFTASTWPDAGHVPWVKYNKIFWYTPWRTQESILPTQRKPVVFYFLSSCRLILLSSSQIRMSEDFKLNNTTQQTIHILNTAILSEHILEDLCSRKSTVIVIINIF
jgi:hypothetical protein